MPTFRGKSVTITLLLLSNSISIFWWFFTTIISGIFLSSFARPCHTYLPMLLQAGYGSTPMYGGSIVFVCVCVHHIYRSGPNLTTSIRSVVSLFQKGTTTVQEYNLQNVVDEQRQTTLNIIRAFPPPHSRNILIINSGAEGARIDDTLGFLGRTTMSLHNDSNEGLEKSELPHYYYWISSETKQWNNSNNIIWNNGEILLPPRWLGNVKAIMSILSTAPTMVSSILWIFLIGWLVDWFLT